MSTNKEKSSNDFESTLKALQNIVDDMEKGDLSLEGSLQAFEKGIKLSQKAQKTLQNAEQKVNLLIQNNETLQSEPFIHKDGDS